MLNDEFVEGKLISRMVVQFGNQGSHIFEP